MSDRSFTNESLVQHCLGLLPRSADLTNVLVSWGFLCTLQSLALSRSVLPRIVQKHKQRKDSKKRINKTKNLHKEQLQDDKKILFCFIGLIIFFFSRIRTSWGQQGGRRESEWREEGVRMEGEGVSMEGGRSQHGGRRESAWRERGVRTLDSSTEFYPCLSQRKLQGREKCWAGTVGLFVF